VALIVGPEQVSMAAHKEVLTVCDGFFASCLEDERFAEGVKNEIKLPDETPENVGKILSFLYLCMEDNERQVSFLCLTEVVEYYILAQKYCITEMAHIARLAVNDSLICFPRKTPRIYYSHLKLLKDSGLTRSDMWFDLLREVCRHILKHKHKSEELRPMPKEGLESDLEATTDILRMVYDLDID